MLIYQITDDKVDPTRQRDRPSNEATQWKQGFNEG